MTPVGNLVAFTATAALFIAIPGPSVLFTISRALTVGRRNALLTVAGNAVGLTVQAVAAAFGMGALVAHSALAFTIVKYVGVGYIIFLGIQAIRHRHRNATALAQRVGPVTSTRAVRDGIVVGATNPKTIVVFVAVMPGFAAPATGHLPLQLLLLGTLFAVLALLLDSVWALAAGTARAWLARSPRRMAAVGGTGGLVMIGAGASLAFTGRKD